jgi:hypothetical protein
MKTLKIISLLFLTGIANAGILDVWHYGIKDNPDRYISVDLLATTNHQMGLNQLPDLGSLGANQTSQYNDRGMRGQLRIPLDSNSTFLFGGNWYTGDYAYDGTGVLLSQTGLVRGFGLEAGFRFYIHD